MKIYLTIALLLAVAAGAGSVSGTIYFDGDVYFGTAKLTLDNGPFTETIFVTDGEYYIPISESANYVLTCYVRDDSIAEGFYHDGGIDMYINFYFWSVSNRDCLSSDTMIDPSSLGAVKAVYR